jgi:hypothetical protein
MASRPTKLSLDKTDSRSGAKQVAERGGNFAKSGGEHPSAAKAGIDSAGPMYGLKPVPFTKSSFSAA